MGVEPAFRHQDHAGIGESGDRAQHRPRPGVEQQDMNEGDRRGDRGEAGEGTDVARRGDQWRQQQGAEGIAGEIGRHHRADRLLTETLVAGPDHEKRAL
jgi:hypothetical protein